MSLTRTSDKNVITMHRPHDGAELWLWKQQRDTAPTVRLQLASPFLQLITPRCCSWTSSVQRLAQLPKMRCPEFGSYIVRQLNKGVSLFLQRRKTLAERQTRPRQCLNPRPAASCVCDHSFDLTVDQVSLRSTRVCHRNDHGTPGQPT